MNMKTFTEKMYFITFINDYSRFMMIYLLSQKGELISKLKEFVTLTKNKFRKKIKTTRTDNAREYLGDDFENHLIVNGIEHQLSVPYCSPQNGVTETKNRTVVDIEPAMLFDANLAKEILERRNSHYHYTD